MAITRFGKRKERLAERFANRTMTKREYKVLYSLYRGDYWKRIDVPDSIQDNFRQGRETYFYSVASELPDCFKYSPVSDEYTGYLMERWGDWGGDRAAERAERAASWYHNGGSVFEATLILNGILEG